MTSADVEHVCRELPEEILVSNVLPRLPMASLCRFQAVCKKWNALLTQSDFAAQHALVSPAEEFVLMTLQPMHLDNCLGGWNVLDVAKSKIFSLSHNFLATPARCGSIPSQERRILAASGGLLFVLYGNIQDHSLIVCNLILKAVKVIPLLPQEWGRYYMDDVVMSTDRVSMEYNIVVFHRMDKHYQTNCMDVFESKIGRWRRVVNTSKSSRESWYIISSFVTLKSASYRLYMTEGNWKPCLIEYDQTTGMGSILDFPEPLLGDWDCLRSSLELVVCQDRLFCMYRPKLGHNIEHKFVEIFELFPKQHEWESLVRMLEALLHWLDSNDLNLVQRPKMELGHNLHYSQSHFVPIGCGSSILFCSSVSRFATYDLVEKSWHQFSCSSPFQLHKPKKWSLLYFNCRNFGLSLCPP